MSEKTWAEQYPYGEVVCYEPEMLEPREGEHEWRLDEVPKLPTASGEEGA